MRTKDNSPRGGEAMRAAVPRRDRSAHPRVMDFGLPGYPESAAPGPGHLEPARAVPTKPFPVGALAARVRGMIAE